MKNVIVRMAVVSALIAFMCTMTLAAASSAEGGGTCMITELKGKVTVDGKKAEMLKMLKPGQVLRSDSGTARVSISFFADGHIDTLQGKFEAKIESNSIAVTGKFAKESKNILKPLSGTMNPRAVERAKAGAMGTRGTLIPVIVNISPVADELITETRPEFLWKRNSDTKYRLLTLKHKGTQRKLALDIVEEGKVSISGDQAPLEPGLWYATFQISRTDVDNPIDFTFLVASPEDLKLVRGIEDEAQKLQKNNPGDMAPAISLIKTYFNLGLYRKAQENMDRIIGQAQDNTYLAGIKEKIDKKLNKHWLK